MGKKKKSEFPHVFVATPAYDGKVDTDYAQSLAESFAAATVCGIYPTACVMANGAFIELARNCFVRLFLEENKDCTHLFFIDSDLKWQSSAFVNLILHCTRDRPVVAGAYRRREENETYPIMWAAEPELSTETEKKLWGIDGWLQCNRVATGFLCIHRSVVEEMAADASRIHVQGQAPLPELFYTKKDEEGRFVGEDFAWCDDYIERYGKKIEVWPDFDFVHGGRKGNYAKWLEKEIKAYKHSTEDRRRLGSRAA